MLNLHDDTNKCEEQLLNALQRQPAVALLGPRQAGKTTLARSLTSRRPMIYLDLEAAGDRAKLTEPVQFIRAHPNALLILDEVQRVPELFACLRGVIDQERRDGDAIGRFLILGSASLELSRQSSESLAGRIALLELTPLSAEEIEVDLTSQERLWLRGGFPGS